MRVLCEAQILAAVDHPFVASLWGTISTPTHLHFLMEPCAGGELYAVLNSQPHKRFPEATMRFYAAEVGRPSRARAPGAPHSTAPGSRAHLHPSLHTPQRDNHRPARQRCCTASCPASCLAAWRSCS